MPNGIAVVVIAHNEDDVIERCLLSVVSSVQYLQEREPSCQVEVVLVNDGSTDDTVVVASNCMAGIPYFKIVSLEGKQGIGAARNQGVHHTKGDLLWFLDGDDTVFDIHLWVAYKVFLHSETGVAASLIIDTLPDVVLDLPRFTEPLGFLRTGVKMDRAVLPEWVNGLEGILSTNIVIRRVCHQFVEGFPNNYSFRVVGHEDLVYGTWVSALFNGVKIPLETVQYWRYPGNFLDRDIRSGKLTTPMNKWVDPVKPTEETMHNRLINRIRLNHLAYLREKLLLVGTEDVTRFTKKSVQLNNFG